MACDVARKLWLLDLEPRPPVFPARLYTLRSSKFTLLMIKQLQPDLSEIYREVMDAASILLCKWALFSA